MKKLIFAFATMLMGIAPAIAQDITTIPDNTLYVLDATVKPGERATLSVQMKNNVDMLTISTYFTLPEGVTVPQEDDFYLIDLSTERTTARKHNLSSNYVNGEYRVVAIHSANKPFDGTEGEVFTITVDVAETVAPGEYEIKLFNTELVDSKNAIVTKKGTYTGKITVADPTGVNEAVADAAGTEVEIYDTNGQKLPALRSGINIVKDVNSGVARKVTVK
ncbi:MAG: hypothetical protein J6B33_03270 [Prevotella sp.]|nr:hypothetical protein [Prevotella sp.]